MRFGAAAAAAADYTARLDVRPRRPARASSPPRSSRGSSERWLGRACSIPSPRARADENYSIAIPPPNVTGALHMGHALNGSIQDTLIRYHRMRGQAREVDPRHRPRRHRDAEAGREAAASTRARSREEIGREAFIERVWEWREQYGGTIIEQFKRLGASLRLRATSASRSTTRYVARGPEGLRRPLREGPASTATTTWSTGIPGSGSAISDLEVEQREVVDTLYSIAYPLKDGGEVVVATVRPETMLADTAVAVNPDDERYKRPDRRVPRCCRSSAASCRSSATTTSRPEFGTGCAEDHARPRSERLRDRPPPRARRGHGDRRGRPHDRGRRATSPA